MIDKDTIILSQPITQAIASNTIKAIESSAAPHLYIDSPGGSAAAGLKIMHCIESHGNVATICYGKAYSAAADILVAGTAGKRSIHKTALVCIHPAFIGHNSKLSEERQAILLAAYRHRLQALWQQYAPKVSLDSEQWFDAQQSLDLGIVDHILS